MKLTGKQKSFLRSKGQVLKPLFQLGKEGFTSSFQSNVETYLVKNELVKISILDTCSLEKKEIIEKFQEAEIEVVQSIGKTLLLYKNNPKLEKGIVLP